MDKYKLFGFKIIPALNDYNNINLDGEARSETEQGE